MLTGCSRRAFLFGAASLERVLLTGTRSAEGIVASGHRRVPHPKAGHMAAPTSNSASGQHSSCQHRAVNT